MRSARRLLWAAVAAAIGQCGVSTTQAANRTWDGGAPTDSVALPANWDGDTTVPGAGDVAVFAGTEGLSPTFDASTQWLGLNFAASAGGFTFSGEQLVLGASPNIAGNLNASASTVTQTFNNAVGSYGGTFTSGTALTGALVFNGLINIGMGNNVSNNSITFTGNAEITLNGGFTTTATATSSANLTKAGNGTLFVNGDNSSNAGRVFINGGAIRINNSNALGTGGGSIETLDLENTGALELTNNITLTKNVLTRGRQGAATEAVSIRNVSGDNVLNTVTTTTGGVNYNYEVSTGSLQIASWNTTGSAAARTLRLSGASGTGEITNWTSASNNVLTVVKNGGNTWTLGSGFGVATGVIGPVTVNAGQLTLQSSVGQRVTGNVLIANGGTLRVETADGNSGEVGNGTSPTTLTIQQGGTLDASQFTDYSLQVGQTLVGGGTVKTSGQFHIFGDNPVYVGNNTANVAQAGTLNIQGNATFTNVGNSGSPNLHFDLSPSTTVGGGVNDLIDVSGAVTIDNSSGPIQIGINPLTGALGSGTYRLIQHSGGTLNAGDFAFTGGINGESRQSLSIGTAPGEVDLIVSGNVGNLVWNGTAVANTWQAAAVQAWLNNGSPDRFFQGDIVSFTDAAAEKTVSLVGSVQPASVTVNSNGDYRFVGSGTIDGVTTLVKNGTGALTIGNTSANTFTGGTTLNAGTLNVNSSAALGTGSLTINGGALGNTSGALVTAATNNALNVNADFAFAGPDDLDMGTGTVTFGGAGTSRTLSVNAGSLTVGVLKTATMGLSKQGTGTLVFTTSGIGDGTLTASTGGTVIAGTLNVAAGVVQINRTGSAAATSGDMSVGAITGTGTIVNGANDERWLFVTNNTDDTFAGTLANGGPGGLGLRKGGTGTLTLTGANTYSGATTIVQGVLNVQNSDALGASTVTDNSRSGGLQLQGGITLPSTVRLFTSNDGTGTVPYAIDNVSGDNTISGPVTLTDGGGSSIIQSDSGSLTLAGNITINTGKSSRGIILQGASTGANTVSGVVSDLSATSVNSITKNGAGTWTVTGANTYTGATTVTGGLLNVGVASRAAVLPATPAATQFLDIRGGKIALVTADANDAAALSSQVLALLDAGFDQATKFSSGQIRSTSLQANRLLGWRDSGTSVEIAYTVGGDADLSFSVGFADLLALAKNYNGTDKVWAQGDFDYSGTVDFSDLLALAKNYNQSVTPAQAAELGASFAGDFALAQSLVPEPATLTTLCLSLGALLARRRSAQVTAGS